MKHTIDPYTAQQIATLQARLEKKLGPEWISQRPGQGGKKCGYVQASKVIELANDVFGFNGWSSQIKECQVDFVDEKGNDKFDMGLSVIMRVTLRDGTYHEDVGYGHVENFKGKGLAFEKSKKEATTDAMKRALRSFGNVLGNCIYDPIYMKEVVKMKVEPKAFKLSDLHRHSSYATVEQKKAFENGPETAHAQAQAPEVKKDDDEFDYDFDDDDFNQTYIDPNAHPDEVVIEPEPRKPVVFRGNQNQQRATSSGYTPQGNNAIQAQNRQPMQAPPKPNMNNQPQPRHPNAPQQLNSNSKQNIATPQHSGQPMTPKSNFARSYSGPVPASGPMAAAGPPRQLNQPSRQGSVPPTLPIPPPAATAGGGNAAPPPKPVPIFNDPDFISAPPGGFEVGFFSGKAVNAGLVNPEAATAPVSNLPQTAKFNPNAESPSIRKTAGFDHSKTGAVKNREPSVAPEAAPDMGGGGFKMGRNNGGAFKRPSMNKRPGEVQNQGQERTALGNMPANAAMGQQQQQQWSKGPSNEPDVKRPRLNGP